MIYRFSFTIAVAIALNFACEANGLVNVPGFDKFNAIGQNNSHIRERADYGNGTSNRDMGIRLPLLIAEDQKDFLENEPSRKNIALKGTQVTVDNIIYDVSGDTAIVYNGKSCSGAVTIPESITYNGKSYRTTTIGAGAFCAEIMSFAINPTYEPKPFVGFKGTLTSFDVRHLIWNITSRLGLGKGKPYSVELCINFIRTMFPDLCKDLDNSTLKNLRVTSTSDKIHIDLPGKDGISFHIPPSIK